jgi:TPP-dependent pyruvate/acetoin dehydrogenase alpha subunit
MWRERDPTALLIATMIGAGELTDTEAEMLVAQAKESVDHAVSFGRNSPRPHPSEACDDIYA